MLVGNPSIVRVSGKPKEVKVNRKKPFTETTRTQAQKRKREEVMECPKGTDNEAKPQLTRSVRQKTQTK